MQLVDTSIIIAFAVGVSVGLFIANAFTLLRLYYEKSKASAQVVEAKKRMAQIEDELKNKQRELRELLKNTINFKEK